MWLLDFFKSKFSSAHKALNNLIRFQENDPGTPDLAVLMEIPTPPSPCPPFAVLNFNGGDGAEGTIEHQAAGVYCTMVFSLRHAQGVLYSPIVRWPALTKLIANPRSGKMFNAYYDRYYLNFFYDDDPVTHQTIYTADSADVVAHELGHAILDALRPDLWAVQCVEIQAFHEAFGDINAILTGLTWPEMVKYIMNETGGDLKKDNVVSRLAEQMGLAIWHAQGNAGSPQNYALRNANNTFQYQSPETLPTRAPDNQLAGEPHSFSRVFTGAWYDALVNVYNIEKQDHSPEDAIQIAREKMAKITFNGVRFAPVSPRFYGSVLAAMLTFDHQGGLGCTDAIHAAFAAHNIQPPTSFTLNLSESTTVSDNLQQEAMALIASSSTNTVRVSDFEESEEPLTKCIIELANTNKIPIMRLHLGENMDEFHEALAAAKHSLRVIQEHDRVGNGPTTGQFHDKEFTVIDGRLIRNYYCCRCHA
jgi:hypothetical protein